LVTFHNLLGNGRVLEGISLESGKLFSRLLPNVIRSLLTPPSPEKDRQAQKTICASDTFIFGASSKLSRRLVPNHVLRGNGSSLEKSFPDSRDKKRRAYDFSSLRSLTKKSGGYLLQKSIVNFIGYLRFLVLLLRSEKI
jgi:hypothetical protein